MNMFSVPVRMRSAQLWFFCNTNHGKSYLEISIHLSTPAPPGEIHETCITQTQSMNRETKRKNECRKCMCVCVWFCMRSRAETLNAQHLNSEHWIELE